MRNWWIERGSTECQEKDGDFRESRAPKVNPLIQRNLLHTVPRRILNRLHYLIAERVERTWLCYTVSAGRLYCFAYKVAGAKLPCKFISGLNVGKKGKEKIFQKRNNQSHRNVQMTLSPPCISSGRVDHCQVKQYEEVCFYSLYGKVQSTSCAFMRKGYKLLVYKGISRI